MQVSGRSVYGVILFSEYLNSILSRCNYKIGHGGSVVDTSGDEGRISGH